METCIEFILLSWRSAGAGMSLTGQRRGSKRAKSGILALFFKLRMLTSNRIAIRCLEISYLLTSVQSRACHPRHEVFFGGSDRGDNRHRHRGLGHPQLPPRRALDSGAPGVTLWVTGDRSMNYDWEGSRVRRLRAFRRFVIVTIAALLGTFALLAARADAQECQLRRTCSKISSCEEAMWYLEHCSWGRKLDRDGDGRPCESLCGSS